MELLIDNTTHEYFGLEPINLNHINTTEIHLKNLK